MCLSSQQTQDTKGGDNIAKTQTQTFPVKILDTVPPQQNKITNEERNEYEICPFSCPLKRPRVLLV